MSEYAASYLFKDADFTPNEERPDGEGYRPKRYEAASAEEAAAIAKRQLITIHAEWVREKRLLIMFEPGDCVQMFIIEYGEPDRRYMTFDYAKIAT